MSLRPVPIVLSETDRSALHRLLRAGSSEQRLAQRVRMILLAGEGAATKDIAARVQVMPRIVSKWRNRFAELGIPGLDDAPRSVLTPTYDVETQRRVLALLDEPAPSGFASWNGRLLAKALGNVSSDQVWSILRRLGISLQRRHSWCVSTDPEFEAKAAEIVGLYIAPPENAIVLCVDEKPSIQALERAQGWLRLPNGKAITGYSHEYKRHGTTTLFAALETATGLVTAGHYKRKRRREFLDFMNSLVSGYPPNAELHVILDNFSTHKPKDDRWLRHHKNVHFHYTPTHASWLNMVEIWFGILWRNALRGASFTSPQQVRQAIDRYIEAYTQDAHPFEWTKTVVYQSKHKHKYINLCK